MNKIYTWKCIDLFEYFNVIIKLEWTNFSLEIINEMQNWQKYYFHKIVKKSIKSFTFKLMVGIKTAVWCRPTVFGDR